MKGMMYERRRVEVVSFETLVDAGYEIDDGSPGQNAWIGEMRVDDLLAVLTPRQREAVLLYADGYDGRIVRERMRIKHKEQLCRLMNRARQRIRDYIQLSENS